METLTQNRPQTYISDYESIDVARLSFPDKQTTSQYYMQLFEASVADLPVREAGPGEIANATVIQADEAPLNVQAPEVRQEALRNCALKSAREATAYSWWCDITDDVEFIMDKKPAPGDMMIGAKHHFAPTVNGVEMEAGYDVYEMGQPSDASDMETVANTLNIIDQYSGGALAGSRVVLIKDTQWQDNTNGKQALGINGKDATYVNVQAIHELADSTATNPSDLLSTILVHEMLGHGLERRRTGDTGGHFREHFEYSEEFTPGDIFSAIHRTIQAKDKAHSHSHPVREYGAVSSAEDLATSVDAEISKAEGWHTAQIPRFASKPDEYRRDIVMQLMTEAAEMVGHTAGNPGIVGGEIRYYKDKDGNVIGSGPARTLEHTVIDAHTAIRQELDDIASKCVPHEVIVARQKRGRGFII